MIGSGIPNLSVEERGWMKTRPDEVFLKMLISFLTGFSNVDAEFMEQRIAAAQHEKQAGDSRAARPDEIVNLYQVCERAPTYRARDSLGGIWRRELLSS